MQLGYIQHLKEGNRVAKLWEVAKLIRSKNAGPFELTIDIMFDDDASFRRVAASRLGRTDFYARLYRIEESAIQLFLHEDARAIKVSFPRPVPSGDLMDSDVFGGQFHAPLVMEEID